MLLTILVLALILRIYVAVTTIYIWDEIAEWIPAAREISFVPGMIHIPIRTLHHGALSAYIIELGALLVGDNALGYRIMSVLAGTGTVALVAMIANAWAGRAAALWAASFVAFNEYHAMISMLAIQKAFSLFFAALAAYVFIKALQQNRPSWLIAVAIASGLSILSYEIMYLLIPTFAIAVIFSERRSWFRSAYLYGAILVGLVIILPDLLWNFVGSHPRANVGYAGHMTRSGGLGLNGYYFMFFFQDLILAVYGLFGKTLGVSYGEYAAMNSLLGLILFGATLVWTWRFAFESTRRKDVVLLFLLAMFWVVFLFFSFMKPGTSSRLDTWGWVWIDLTLIPAAVFTGALISQLKSWRKGAVIAASLLGLLYATVEIATTRFDLPPDLMALVPYDKKGSGGETNEYRAVFNRCFICEKNPQRKLVDIWFRNSDGELVSALRTGDVVDVGQPPSEFIFRVNKARLYFIEYEVMDWTGRMTRVVAPNGGFGKKVFVPFWISSDEHS